MRKFSIMASFILFVVLICCESKATSCDEDQMICLDKCIPLASTCYECGDNCRAYLSDDETNPNGKKQLNIIGSGEMTSAPWRTINNNSFKFQRDITNIVIQDNVKDENGNLIKEGITSIPTFAFYEMAGVKGTITIPNSVVSIGQRAFSRMTGLSGLVVGDSVSEITGKDAFRTNSNLEVIISDKIDTSKWHLDTFADASDKVYVNFKCMGNQEVCKNSMRKFIQKADGGTCVYCMKADQVSFGSVDESLCIKEPYYWSGSSCNNKNDGIICAERFKRNEDFCNRVRYTPAEAAAVAKDDGNVVTLTFKK